MEELRLSVKEWHLLSIAYQQMVEREIKDEVAQREREALADRVAVFSAQVYRTERPVVVCIEK